MKMTKISTTRILINKGPFKLFNFYDCVRSKNIFRDKAVLYKHILSVSHNPN